MAIEGEPKTIGILGGLGPRATVKLFEIIVEQTPADKDQNHIPIIIYNKPQVPDRTKAILHNGENPIPILQKTAKKLESAGADFLIIPCNTAHYFIDDIRDSIEIPILNMVKSTIDQIPSKSKTGLLATSGTIKTGIYQQYGDDKIKIITPDKKFQEKLMNIIYGEQGIKAGYYDEDLKKKMLEVVSHLENRGAENIIAGCTEVRFALNDDLENLCLYKPMDIIADKAIQKALKNK